MWLGDARLSNSFQSSVKDIDFEFENSPVKIVVDKEFPEMKIVGETIGSLDKGTEVEVKYWVALELVRAGFAHFHETESLSLTLLQKIQWKETVQPGRQLSAIPENLYPKIRRYINELKLKSTKDTSYLNEVNKALRLAQDIVNCRLRKIVGLAASSGQTDVTLQNLCREERILYNSLHTVISKWRLKILEVGVSK